jgi:hypothetical protein
MNVVSAKGCETERGRVGDWQSRCGGLLPYRPVELVRSGPLLDAILSLHHGDAPLSVVPRRQAGVRSDLLPDKAFYPRD